MTSFDMKPIVLGAIALLAVSAAGIGGTFAWERYVQLPEARSALLKSLRDPDSTKFQNEIFNPAAKRVCGEFNSKNAYGAYVGFKRFISGAGTRYFIEGGSYKTWDVPTGGVLSDSREWREELEKQIATLKAANGDDSELIAYNRRDGDAFTKAWADFCQID